MSVNTDVNQSKLYPKTLDAINLVNAGVSPEDALKYVNFKQNIRKETVSRFKAKLKKHSLQSPNMVKLAHNAVKDCLTDQPIVSKRTDKQGNEIIEETPPTWTNKLAAASMVMDRVEPAIRQNLNVNANVDVHPVDLGRWLNGQGDEKEAIEVDITPKIEAPTR